MIRPLAGRVAVRPLPEMTAKMRTSLILPGNVRSGGTYVAEVMAVGADVDAVKPGDVVLVEMMSGQSGEVRGDAAGGSPDDILAIVPCRPPYPAQRREEEYAERMRRRDWIRKQYPDVARRPPELHDEIQRHEREIPAIRASRKGRGRSKLIPWVQDRGVGIEGILAVIEPEDDDGGRAA